MSDRTGDRTIPRGGGAAHLPALDGVRGVAILCVMARHLTNDIPIEPGPLVLPRVVAALGWVGVNLFFVLSGFLITGILIASRGAPGYARSFYTRRALRIWPLYLLVLAVLAVVVYGFPHLAPDDAARFHRFAPWYVTHTANVRIALDGAWESPFRAHHLWSLALEEQFYLAWPLVVAVVAPRRLVPVALGLAGTGILARAALLAAGAPPVSLYVLPVTRLDSLVLGAVLAAWAAGHAPPAIAWMAEAARGMPTRRFGIVVALGVFVLLAMSPTGAPYEPALQLAGWPIVAVIGGIIVVRATRPTGAPTWLLAPWLRGLGVISYGVYMVHELVHYTATRVLPGWHPLARLPLIVAVSIAVAYASWRWWESPWLRLKRYVPRPVPVPAAKAVAADSRATA